MKRSSSLSPVYGATRIRVTLDVCRSDDPLLFDALACLSKGRRRVARLRMLAHDGLAISSGQVVVTPVNSGHDREPTEESELAAVPANVTSALFEPPLFS
jgi:hypothetical protein